MAVATAEMLVSAALASLTVTSQMTPYKPIAGHLATRGECEAILPDEHATRGEQGGGCWPT